MKTAPVAILLLASAVLGIPTEKDVSVRPPDSVKLLEDSGKMAVTGPIFEGGPDVTLYGTAREVYDQILALNPHAFDNVTDSTVGTSPVRKRGMLDRRAWPIECNPNTHPDTTGAIGWEHCSDNMETLRALGNRQCSAPANACRRPGFSYYCAFWLCDKSGKGITVTCRHIADDAQAIYDKCRTWSPDGMAVKGRMWVSNTHTTSVEWNWK